MNKFIKCFINPFYGCSKLLNRLAPFINDDELYIKLDYFFVYKKILDLNDPQTFNAKIQWLKLYDRNPDYSKMVDKFAVKEFIEQTIGSNYVIPAIGVWKKFEDIDFKNLPEQFVLKCTHDSGGLVICKDKKCFNTKVAKKVIENSLKRNYYTGTREFPYKNVEPQIIAEPYLKDDKTDSLIDYKVLCFNGKAKLIELYLGRYSNNLTLDFYDTSWNKTQISQSHFAPNSTILYPKPKNLPKMIEFSELISKDMAHCRVDWYEINGKLYFGEITFYDGSGLSPFDSEEDEIQIGSWIDLRRAFIYRIKSE